MKSVLRPIVAAIVLFALTAPSRAAAQMEKAPAKMVSAAAPAPFTGPSLPVAAPGLTAPGGVPSLASSQVSAAPAQFHFAVVGAGDVVKNYYSPAFQQLKQKYAGRSDIKVTFIDDSRFWRNDPLLSQKAQGIIAELKSWGAEVLDASDAEAGQPAIQALRPDVLVIATPDFLHIDKTMEWLDRAHGPKRILIEKPLDRDRHKALALLNRLGYGQDRVLVLDHYLARLMPKESQLDLMDHHLGGGIKSFAYYFLEDHSGDDPTHKAIADRDGAIEREQRAKALNGGAVLDAIPHLFPLLRDFVDLERARVTGVRAAQYTGVDGDPDKRTEIQGETFAEIRFNFFRKPGIFREASAALEGLVEGVAYVGKGVHGVRTLGPNYDRNTKMLEVVGLSGKTIRFDLRSSSPDGSHSKAYLLDENGEQVAEFPLYAKPYQVIFERALLDDVDDFLHIEQAERILEVIERIVDPIRAKGVLDTYPGGMKGARTSPYLEDIQEKVPYLFNHPTPAQAAQP